MAEKKLGKGLGAIFGDDIDSVLDEIAKGEGEVESVSTYIKLADIRPNPYQPRKTFNEEGLEELSASIKERGVFQPIIVRKSVSGYELIAGERRVRASKMAGLEEIPATIVDFDDRDMMEVSVLENIQRENLTIIEEAKAYEQLIEKLDYTQEDVATRIGKSRAHVTNVLRILKLPVEVLDLVSNEQLSFGHARALINIEDEKKQIELAKRAVKDNLSVRQIEELAKEEKAPKRHIIPTKSDPYLDDVRRNLEAKLTTSVKVDKSHIVIGYKDSDDLNRILEILNCLEGQ